MTGEAREGTENSPSLIKRLPRTVAHLFKSQPEQGRDTIDPIETMEKIFQQVMTQIDASSNYNAEDRIVIQKMIGSLDIERKDLARRKNDLNKLGVKEVPITILTSLPRNNTPSPGADPDEDLTRNTLYPSTKLKELILISIGAIVGNDSIDTLSKISFDYIHKEISKSDRKKLITASIEPVFGRNITLRCNMPGCVVKVYFPPWDTIQLVMDEQTTNYVIAKKGADLGTD